MKKRGLRKLAELGWVAASLVLILFAVRPWVQSRYQGLWESWLLLPWHQKLQPVELTLKRYLKDSPSAEDQNFTPLTQADLEASVRSGADWLLSNQEASGHFRYWYDPVRDQFSSPDDDSFHRQAGTAYGLTLVYEMFGEQRHLESARRSIEYLFRYKKSLAPDKSYFFFDDRADLGGAALPMLAMLRIRELTGITVYDLELKRLANFLLFLQQQYGTGEFKSTYVYRGVSDIERQLDWESSISPGQAMLALAWMYRNFRDPIYKDSIDTALAFYSEERYWKEGGFLPWTIDAFVSIYRTTGETAYAEYAAKLADYLISLQNLDSRKETFGSFGSFPSVASASSLEGLGSALQLTQATGDSAREARYRLRAQMGYRWLVSLQYSRDSAAGLRSPERAVGGFAQSLGDPRIRIDYNQHAISALVRGLRFVFGKPPDVPSQVAGRN